MSQYAEAVDDFRHRARTWLSDNMPVVDPGDPPQYRIDSVDSWNRARELQRRIYAGGLAGICFPTEYGGLGLPYEYQRAFDAETGGYELPYLLNVPSLAICAATILDLGTEEQKREHIAAAIRGDEVLAQLLSEPGAGSDLASVSTRSECRNGKWIINGSKIWSTAAFAADYGLCLTRSNWSVPKHEGLTMFLVGLNQPGVTVRRIVQINGRSEFCEVFLDDVEVPVDAMVGEENMGWAVASRQLYHERRAMGGGSEFASGIDEFPDSNRPIDLIKLARKVGKEDDTSTMASIGKVLAQWTVHDELIPHVMSKIADGQLPDTAGSIIRIFVAETEQLANDVGAKIAGAGIAVGGAEDSDEEITLSRNFLSRQIISIGGGTSEMARNVISERILNMPREVAADRGIPFNEVKGNRSR